MTENKKFPVYEKQIDALIKKNKLDGDTHLLRMLYGKYFKSRTKDDQYKWSRGKLSNFLKMKKGEREFTPEFKLAISEYAGMPFSAFECLGEDSDVKPDDFCPKGIRYAAYKDDIKLYQRLLDETDADESPVIYNYDEYTKTIVDYVVEYGAENGLRFLIENGIIYLDDYGLGSFNLYRAKKRSADVWNMICKIDDTELFYKVFEERAEISIDLSAHHFLQDDDRERFLDALLNTKEIYENLLSPKTVTHLYGTEVELRCMSTLLLALFERAIEKGDKENINKILDKYSEFIEQEVKNATSKIDKTKINDFYCYDDRYKNRIIYMNDDPLIICWEIPPEVSASEEIQKRISMLSAESIIKMLQQKKLSEMVKGEIRYDIGNGILYICCDKDIRIEMLECMTSNNFTGVPRYYGEESGVHKIEMLEPYRDIVWCELKDIIAILSEIHRISEAALGEGRVYLHGRSMKKDLCKRRRFGKPVLGGWENCKIGDPIEDIVTAVLEFTSVCCDNNYRNNKESLESIKAALSDYYKRETVENFGDKLIDEIDSRLKTASKKERGSLSEFEQLYLAKAFAEMYREELNNSIM